MDHTLTRTVSVLARAATALLLSLLVTLPTPRPASSDIGDVPPPPPAPTDWPQVQKDAQRTGRSPEQINPTYAMEWTWNTDQSLPIRFSHKTQPIVAYGHMYIGGLDGKVYAVDLRTGRTAWSFATGGPILNAGAAEAGRVLFGSDDAKLYALDATSGAKLWEYQAGAGFDAAPLIVGGTMYIGSKDGTFYALNIVPSNPSDPATILAWRYKVGYPIYQTAAYSASANAIVFGAEDLYVYALNLDGTLKWRTPNKLPGQSFRHYWPVVSDRHGVVILRTSPAYYFHDMLDSGDSVLRTANGGNCPTDTAGDASKRAAEQAAIRDYLTANPYRRTFHVLDVHTGRETLVAPILYVGGSGSTPAPPVIDTDGNAIVVWRSCYSTFDSPSMVRGYTGLGKLDLTNGTISPYVRTATGNHAFRLISDEESVLSLSGSNLLISITESVGIHNISNNTEHGVVLEGGESGNVGSYNMPLSIFDSKADPIYSSQHSGGHLAPEWSPAVISNGLIIWKADGSAIAAVAGQ